LIFGQKHFQKDSLGDQVRLVTFLKTSHLLLLCLTKDLATITLKHESLQAHNHGVGNGAIAPKNYFQKHVFNC